MLKKRYLIDLDDVVFDFSIPFFRFINEKTGTVMSPDVIDQDYENCDAFKGLNFKKLLLAFEYEIGYENLPFMPGAKEAIRELPGRSLFVTRRGGLYSESNRAVICKETARAIRGLYDIKKDDVGVLFIYPDKRMFLETYLIGSAPCYRNIVIDDSIRYLPRNAHHCYLFRRAPTLISAAEENHFCGISVVTSWNEILEREGRPWKSIS